MDIKCKLEFYYDDEKTAKTVFDSVDVDNYGYVDAELREKKIVSRIKAKNLASLLHTLEDYLSCVSIAEKMMAD
jgi:tRNA threonylcarbamoyladenosine modification (KEOPS) complex  Pcc1 subunit